jgi:hypothetical protein
MWDIIYYSVFFYGKNIIYTLLQAEKAKLNAEPIAQRNQSLASSNEVWQYIKESNISKVRYNRLAVSAICDVMPSS